MFFQYPLSRDTRQPSPRQGVDGRRRPQTQPLQDREKRVAL